LPLLEVDTSPKLRRSGKNATLWRHGGATRRDVPPQKMPSLSVEDVERIRSDCFADDVSYDYELVKDWTEERVTAVCLRVWNPRRHIAAVQPPDCHVCCAVRNLAHSGLSMVARSRWCSRVILRTTTQTTRKRRRMTRTTMRRTSRRPTTRCSRSTVRPPPSRSRRLTARPPSSVSRDAAQRGNDAPSASLVF
jgi:hypothetical protein